MKLSNQKNFLWIKSFLLFSLLIWLVGIFFLCFKVDGSTSYYPFVKQLYSTTCHQDEAKSFYCGNTSLMVCARCTGIYIGASMGLLLSLITIIKLKISIKTLLIFSLPMLIDVILYSIDLYSYSKIIAFSTGMLFGSSVILFIFTTLENFSITNSR